MYLQVGVVSKGALLSPKDCEEDGHGHDEHGHGYLDVHSWYSDVHG